MSMRSRFRLRSLALAAVCLVTGAAPGAAIQAADAQAAACPYGYFYSDGACLAYSWNAQSSSDDDSDYGVFINGARRGERHGGMRGGGFHDGDHR